MSGVLFARVATTDGEVLIEHELNVSDGDETIDRLSQEAYEASRAACLAGRTVFLQIRDPDGEIASGEWATIAVVTK